MDRLNLLFNAGLLLTISVRWEYYIIGATFNRFFRRGVQCLLRLFLPVPAVLVREIVTVTWCTDLRSPTWAIATDRIHNTLFFVLQLEAGLKPFAVENLRSKPSLPQSDRLLLVELLYLLLQDGGTLSLSPIWVCSRLDEGGLGCLDLLCRGYRLQL